MDSLKLKKYQGEKLRLGSEKQNKERGMKQLVEASHVAKAPRTENCNTDHGRCWKTVE